MTIRSVSKLVERRSIAKYAREVSRLTVGTRYDVARSTLSVSLRSVALKMATFVYLGLCPSFSSKPEGCHIAYHKKATKNFEGVCWYSGQLRATI